MKTLLLARLAQLRTGFFPVEGLRGFRTTSLPLSSLYPFLSPRRIFPLLHLQSTTYFARAMYAPPLLRLSATHNLYEGKKRQENKLDIGKEKKTKKKHLAFSKQLMHAEARFPEKERERLRQRRRGGRNEKASIRHTGERRLNGRNQERKNTKPPADRAETWQSRTDTQCVRVQLSRSPLTRASSFNNSISLFSVFLLDCL